MLGTYMHFSLENHLPIIPAIISFAGFGIMPYVTCCTLESILTCECVSFSSYFISTYSGLCDQTFTGIVYLCLNYKL